MARANDDLVLTDVSSFEVALVDRDAFAFDKLVVDEASSETSESFLPMDNVVDVFDRGSAARMGDGFFDDLVVAETVPGGVDSIVSSDWLLI
jgi:hypothetical protein